MSDMNCAQQERPLATKLSELNEQMESAIAEVASLKEHMSPVLNLPESQPPSPGGDVPDPPRESNYIETVKSLIIRVNQLRTEIEQIKIYSQL